MLRCLLITATCGLYLCCETKAIIVPITTSASDEKIKPSTSKTTAILIKKLESHPTDAVFSLIENPLPSTSVSIAQRDMETALANPVVDKAQKKIKRRMPRHFTFSNYDIAKSKNTPDRVYNFSCRYEIHR